MSYNQTFTPQSGQGNLSAHFGTPQYQPGGAGGSAPRDIPTQRRRSSTMSGYGGYPPPQQSYGVSPTGGYQGQGGPYGTSPHMQPPPNQMPMYGTSPQSQGSNGYGSPPYSQQPHPNSGPQPGWQYPNYGPQSYPPSGPMPSMRRPSSMRSSSDEYSDDRHSDDHRSHKSHHSHHSSDKKSKKKKSHGDKRRDSHTGGYDSPRRPTMTESLLAAYDGVKGALKDTNKR